VAAYVALVADQLEPLRHPTVHDATDMIDHAATLALAASASVILRLDRILEALPMGQPALSRNPYEHARCYSLRSYS
jgi:hypothetical protein